MQAPTHTQGEIRHLCHRRPTSPPLGVRRHAHQTDVAALPLSKCAPPHTLSRRERANPGKVRASAHTFQVTALPSPQSASRHSHIAAATARPEKLNPAIKPLSQSATTAHRQMSEPPRTLSRKPHSRTHEVCVTTRTFRDDRPALAKVPAVTHTFHGKTPPPNSQPQQSSRSPNLQQPRTRKCVRPRAHFPGSRTPEPTKCAPSRTLSSSSASIPPPTTPRATAPAHKERLPCCAHGSLRKSTSDERNGVEATDDSVNEGGNQRHARHV